MTSTSVEFCDTNVLVYAYSSAAGARWRLASALVDRLWEARSGCLSVQVLQEFYVAATRKGDPPLDPAVARRILGTLSHWRVVEPTARDVLDAADNAARWQVSFWDAMLLTTANKAEASILWTEDLNDGQTYGGVTVRNPFVDDRAG
jgi:predicted nucleic acid-binding protein